eukprot:3039269-Rhodomonas_salina.1
MDLCMKGEREEEIEGGRKGGRERVSSVGLSLYGLFRFKLGSYVEVRHGLVEDRGKAEPDPCWIVSGPQPTSGSRLSKVKDTRLYVCQRVTLCERQKERECVCALSALCALSLSPVSALPPS